MRCYQETAVIVTAVALVPVGAHLLELAGKVAMGPAAYFTVQGLYAGWAWLGIVWAVALLVNGGLALVARRQGVVAVWHGAAAGFMLAAFGNFFLFTLPANRATANWTVQPANWEALRQQWEVSHVVGAALVFLALCCSVAAMGKADSRA